MLMLPAQMIASTAGFTCPLFAIQRTTGVRRVPLVFKYHGSAAASTPTIIESQPVMAAMVAALSVVAMAVALAVVAGCCRR